MNKKVTIELGGKERELKFGTLAVMSIEKELGLSSLTGELFAGLSLRAMIVLTWGALLHANKRLTIEQVAEWYPYESDPEGTFANKLIEALFSSFLLSKGVDPDEVEKKMEVFKPKEEESETPIP